MLPDTCVFEEIAYAKAFRDTEQKGKGSILQGGGMDVPLAVLSQQRQCSADAVPNDNATVMFMVIKLPK